MEQKNVSQLIYCCLSGKISWNWPSIARSPCLSTELLTDAYVHTQTQRRFKQLQKTSAEFRRPHVISPLCLHFSGESASAGRHLIFMLPVSRCATHGEKKKQQLACGPAMTAGALPAPPLVPVPPLYSRKEQLPWIHTRRKHRISTLSRTWWTNFWSQWPTNLHTPSDCFLSHYLFGHCEITKQAAGQQPTSACISPAIFLSSF